MSFVEYILYLIDFDTLFDIISFLWFTCFQIWPQLPKTLRQASAPTPQKTSLREVDNEGDGPDGIKVLAFHPAAAVELALAGAKLAPRVHRGPVPRMQSP